jgi:hypothetical protein
LIALIINAHPLGSGPHDRSLRTRVLANRSSGWTLIRKTSLSSDRSDGNCGQAMPTSVNAILPPGNSHCRRSERIRRSE